MLASVCVGTNSLKKSGQFYDQVLATIDMARSAENDVEIGYSTDGGKVTFWVLKPFNGNEASFGNGTQVIFSATNQASVDAFYQTAIKYGGTDEGAPGPRSYSENYYGAYCRDMDGNKLHVFCITAAV